MANIAILGAGGFGTALAVMAHKCGHRVTLWSAVERELIDIRTHGQNKRLLPGVAVDASIQLTGDVADVAQCDLVIFAVASVWVRAAAKQVAAFIKPGVILVNVAKGLEEGSLKRLSEVIGEEIPGHSVVGLSGPSHAEEIARGVPTTVVAASADVASAEAVQDILTNSALRIYVNPDIIGVEIGGALKNIIALCAGICDGLDLGDNTKAALMTRGIAEIARLGVAAGGEVATFAGLAGIGDLIVTCTSMHSRNRRAGILIGQGVAPALAVERIGMTVEGYGATQIGHDLSEKYQVQMPITEQLYQVLYQGADTKKAIINLMSRPNRYESDMNWVNKK